MSAGSISLGALDAAPRHESSTEIWARNLDALQAVAPEFAQRVPAELPNEWSCVRAHDSAPTWRIAVGSHFEWWGGTAAPRTRAAGLAAPASLADENPVLPALAPGGELLWLLERLGFHQAIFTFCESWRDAAAFLRLHDVSDALASRRCILLPPDGAESVLAALLEAQPGLRPPGPVLAIPGVSPARIDALQSLCATVTEQAQTARDRRIAALRELPGSRGAESRWAFAALSRGVAARELATALHAAEIIRSGTQRTVLCRLDGPPSAGVLPHLERISALQATDLIFVGQHAAELRLPGMRVYRWHIAEPLAGEPLDAGVDHLAATPRIRDELQRAGAPNARLFPWAADVAREAALEAPLSDEVVIVGDLPDASDSACRIEHPTHRQLWDTARLALTEALDSGRAMSAADALAVGQRRIGHTLADEALSAQFQRLIERVLIPSVWLERITRAVGQGDAAPTAIGSGWSRRSELSVRSVGVTCTGSLDAVLGRPVAVLFTWPNAWPALLPAAAARGWPIVLCGPRPAHQPAGNGYFHAEQHVLFAENPRALPALLQTLRAQPDAARKRCLRAMELVRTAHTYEHRLANLCAS